MTRRAATGFARLLPVPVVIGALVIAVAAVLAACGGGNGGSPQPTATVTVTASPSASPSPSPSASPSLATTPVTLYFVRRGKLGVAERRGPQTTTPATVAIKALLKGPSVAERAAGLSTDIPAGTRLNALALAGGTATADFTSNFAQPAANAVAARRVAETVYTLTQFPTVRRVVIKVGGRPLDQIASGGTGGSPDPLTIASPLRRNEPWTSFEPTVFVESPGVGAVLTSPFILRGSASVFEGSFAVMLVDKSGRRIVRKQVQASQGAPGRGRFRKTIPFSTSATEGTLIVYSVSMEDGSHQGEVRIPVTFAQD